LCLGDEVGCGWVGFEEADAVFLVEEEVEVAAGAGFDGVELALTGCGAQAGEDELLRATGLGWKSKGGEEESHEAADASGERMERARCLHG
jgi:hypothetical protein